jgi:putative phosphoesterase
MKIGVVSDTHGQHGRLRRAIELLRQAGAEYLVHCGDIGGTECLAALGGAGLPAMAVAGNTDAMFQYDLEAAAMGVQFCPRVLTAELPGGIRIAVTHGDDPALLKQLIHDGQYRYVFCGHSHAAGHATVGATQVVNPGALHRARPHTCALVDTDGKVQFLTVDG